MVRATMIFAITSFESILESRKSYILYFVFQMIFCLFAWVLFSLAFDIREEIKTYEIDEETNYESLSSDSRDI